MIWRPVCSVHCVTRTDFIASIKVAAQHRSMQINHPVALNRYSSIGYAYAKVTSQPATSDAYNIITKVSLFLLIIITMSNFCVKIFPFIFSVFVSSSSSPPFIEHFVPVQSFCHSCWHSCRRCQYILKTIFSDVSFSFRFYLVECVSSVGQLKIKSTCIVNLANRQLNKLAVTRDKRKKSRLRLYFP